MKALKNLFTNGDDVFQIYASDDHLLIVGNVMEAAAHAHRFLHLAVHLQDTAGMHTLTVMGTPLVCGAAIINSDVEHVFHGRNSRHALVLIDQTTRLGSCLKVHFLPDNEPYHVLPDSLACELSQKILSVPATPATSLEYHAIWEGILTALGLTHCSLLHTRRDERIEEVLAFLSRSGSFRHSVTSLAKRSFLSPSRLSHLFKEHTGGTLKNYLLIKQLLQALSAVAMGRSATTAALEGGFDTPSHLSSTCRRLLGIQPGNLHKVSAFLKVSLFH